MTFTRLLLLAALATTTTVAATAQTMPASTPPTVPTAATTPLLPPSQVKGNYKNYLRQHYAGDRESLATIHLFKRKQRGGLIWMGTMGGLMGFLGANSGTRTNSDGSTSTLSVTPFGWGVQLGLFAGVGLRKEIRFSNQKLYSLLVAHDNLTPFPLYVREKLKDKDYEAGSAN